MNEDEFRGRRTYPANEDIADSEALSRRSIGGEAVYDPQTEKVPYVFQQRIEQAQKEAVYWREQHEQLYNRLKFDIRGAALQASLGSYPPDSNPTASEYVTRAEAFAKFLENGAS